MNEGPNILTLVRNLQKLNGEIAALIKTFEKLLIDHGFRCDSGNSVIRDCSTSLELSQAWSPLGMYRVFKNKADKDDVIVLNVVLDSLVAPERILEPLILCGRFQYQKGRASKCFGVWDSWDLWLHKAADKTGYLYKKAELGVDSKQFLSESEWREDEVEAMREVRFLAVPLVRMVDRKALEKEIIQPIL